MSQIVIGMSFPAHDSSPPPNLGVKLLIKNQDKMIKRGRFDQPYKGIGLELCLQ
ncbi:hypothetical protein LINPERHAP2_LOCUS24831, partial [Linum perenne]